MIVVDSNIIAYLYLPGDHTAKAESLLTRDAEWVAPILWRSEFRNILAGFMRRGLLTAAAAIDLQTLFTMDAKVRKSFPGCTMPLSGD